METEKQLMAINVSQSETIDLAKTMDLKAAAELEQQKLTILEQEELKLKEAKAAQKQKTDSRLAALQTKIKDAKDSARGAEFLRKTLEEKLAELKVSEEARRKALEESIAQEKKEIEAKIAQAKAEHEKFTATAQECQAVLDKSKKEEISQTTTKSTRSWLKFW
jgi:membrane protein involved in colicin uptake